MRTNSPIDDPTPALTDEDIPKPRQKVSDWRKLGKSKLYPEVNDYIEQRKEYYRRYFPGGTPVPHLTTAERAKYWAVADIVVRELEQFQAQIGANT